MATDAENLANLKTRRSNVAAELAAMTSKPSYSVDGQSVQWVEYRKSLMAEYRELNELIVMLEPFELSITATP